jgi:hypothetical protein
MAGRVAYYGQSVQDGAVLRLDAGKRDSYPGTGTTWRDLSGMQNNGTLLNSPTFNTNNGGILIFDGIDDYCLNTLSNGFTQKLTVITIAKSTNATWSQYAGLGSARVNNGYIIHNNYPSVTSVTFYVINNVGSYTDIGSVTPSNITNYNFYALTTNGTNSHKRYLNGALVGTSTNAITRTDTNSSQGNWLASDSGVAGRLTAVSIGIHLIYNRELSSNEILQTYNAYKTRFEM